MKSRIFLAPLDRVGENPALALQRAAEASDGTAAHGHRMRPGVEPAP